MTTELATIEDSRADLVLSTADPLDNLMRYAEILEVSYKFAEKVCRTGIVPKIYKDKPHDAAVAMMHGAELGLNPLQSLQNVFPVHGMPTVYAKTMVALLRQKGYRFETHETGPERVTFQGWSPNGKETETSTWTIERAIQAEFAATIDPETGKPKTKKFTGANGPYEKVIGNEKYLTQPEDMLWAKAATTVCKRLAPHILLGLGIAEDQEDAGDPEPVRVASERVTPVTSATAVAAGPPVQQWQPPANEQTADEPASQEGAKPDTAQVEEPPAKPPKPSTSTQQKKIARLLDERGIAAPADKLATLALNFDRPFGSSAELTWDEAITLLAHLEDDPVATEQQVERLGALLDENGLSQDKAAEERAAFLAAKVGRPIADLAHLTGREVEVIEALIHGTPAGGAQ